MPYLQDNEKQKGEFNHGKREVPQSCHPPPPFHPKPDQRKRKGQSCLAEYEKIPGSYPVAITTPAMGHSTVHIMAHAMV